MKLFLPRTEFGDSLRVGTVGCKKRRSNLCIKKNVPTQNTLPKVSPCSKIILAGWNIKPATINFTPCIPKADAERGCQKLIGNNVTCFVYSIQ